jgi:hypothetical protein
MAPKDEELLRHALDDESLPWGVEQHLEQCSICRQRLARYKHIETFLTAKLYRSQCPDATKLNFYCAGLMPPDERVDIAKHIAYCPLCADEVADIQYVLKDFVAFSETASPSSLLPTIRRIIASLVPWQPQLVMRGDVASSSWPRQYRAESLNISLHLSRASSGETLLLGLFTSVNPNESIEVFDGVLVDLYHTSDALMDMGEDDSEDAKLIVPVMSSQVDDLGNLVFKAVPMGKYVMIVRLPDTELVINDLAIAHGYG